MWALQANGFRRIMCRNSRMCNATLVCVCVCLVYLGASCAAAALLALGMCGVRAHALAESAMRKRLWVSRWVLGGLWGTLVGQAVRCWGETGLPEGKLRVDGG